MSEQDGAPERSEIDWIAYFISGFFPPSDGWANFDFASFNSPKQSAFQKLIYYGWVEVQGLAKVAVAGPPECVLVVDVIATGFFFPQLLKAITATAMIELADYFGSVDAEPPTVPSFEYKAARMTGAGVEARRRALCRGRAEELYASFLKSCTLPIPEGVIAVRGSQVIHTTPPSIATAEAALALPAGKAREPIGEGHVTKSEAARLIGVDLSNLTRTKGLTFVGDLVDAASVVRVKLDRMKKQDARDEETESDDEVKRKFEPH